MGAVAERWIFLTDSIQTEVLSLATAPEGLAGDLTAMQLPGLVNIVPQLIGAPGLRMTDGGTPGFGACSNKNAIGMASGYMAATGLVIMLGTNDWANPGTLGLEFINDYRATVDYAKGLGLKVVCVCPLWRADEASTVAHADGSSYSLQQFRDWIGQITLQEGVSWIDGTNAPCTSQPTQYADGIHLNQAGHLLFAPWLVSEMRALGFWLAS
jgi:lysophospholipase L1-like esterase